jgi:hypothetical protein
MTTKKDQTMTSRYPKVGRKAEESPVTIMFFSLPTIRLKGISCGEHCPVVYSNYYSRVKGVIVITVLKLGAKRAAKDQSETKGSS